MFLWLVSLILPLTTATVNNLFPRGTVGQAASMFLAMGCLVPYNVYHDVENKATYGAVAGLFLFLIAFGW